MNIKKINKVSAVGIIIGLVVLAVLISVGVGHDDHQEQIWWCPMHPFYKTKKYGICPYCSMELQVYVPSPGDKDAKPELILTDQQVQQAGVRTEKVVSRELVREISTSGIFRKNFDRYWHIDVKFDGWVEELYLTNIGESVKVGQPIAKIYSPKLYASQKEYLVAMDDPVLGPAARKRLELLGIDEREIRELEERGEPQTSMILRSRYEGTVLHQDVHASGERLPSEDPIGHILDIGDLRELWLFADIYDRDIGLVKKGQEARIRVDAFPGKTFSGVVDLIEPLVQADTQTARIRIRVKNDPVQLMIGQFARVNLLYRVSNTLSVSEQAVIPTGRRDIVIVSRGGGRFAAREITLGRRWLTANEPRTDSTRLPFFTGHNRYHEVLSGLEESEMVVTSGAFLLHAETQIRQVFDKMVGAEEEKQAVRSAWSGKIVDPPHIMDGLPFADMSEHGLYNEKPDLSWKSRYPSMASSMDRIFQTYFGLHEAAVTGDREAAASQVGEIRELGKKLTKLVTEAFDKQESKRIRTIASDLASATTGMLQAEDIKTFRRHFGGLTLALERWVEAFGVPGEPMYQFYCGMAKGLVGSPTERWFQPQDELRNPYGMAGCGRLEKPLRRADR